MALCKGFSQENMYYCKLDANEKIPTETAPEMVEKKEMPLNEYTWTHSEAKLSEAQISSLIDWAKRTRAIYQLGAQPE